MNSKFDEAVAILFESIFPVNNSFKFDLKPLPKFCNNNNIPLNKQTRRTPRNETNATK